MQSPEIIAQKDLSQARKQADEIVDVIDQWLASLYEIMHPETIHAPDFEKKQEAWISEQYDDAGGKETYGSWIMFSQRSRNILLHTVDQDSYFDLLTNRNRIVLSDYELQQIRKSKICIFGQSIGGNVAVLLAHAGFGNVAITDFDTLDPTNLNRIYYGSSFDVGRPKVDVVAEEMWSVNPYMNIDVFDKGVSSDNLEEFVTGADVILELIDDFKMKVSIRKLARKNKIPVLMTTNLGRRILIDVERYDLNPTLPIFNGLVEESVLNDIEEGKMSPQDINRYARELVGVDNVDPRALQSLPRIGKKDGLVGRPQIVSTVSASAGIAVNLIAWALGCFDDYGDLASGRKRIELEEIVPKG